MFGVINGLGRALISRGTAVSTDLVNHIFSGLFIVLVIYAMVTDTRYLRIGNSISFSLVGLFFLYVLLVKPDISISQHLLVAFGVFAVGFVPFVLRWFAGGDVKLMTALALWAGPSHILPFAALSGLLGGSLGLAVLAIGWIDKYGEGIGMPTSARRIMPHWAKRGLCPYGLAIGSAALIIMPSQFA